MNDTKHQKESGRNSLDARGPVAVFESIHAVLAAERVFRQAALPCDLVPIPRGVTSDCGVALLFRAVDLQAARVILSTPPLAGRLLGIFIPGPDGYAPDSRSDARRADPDSEATDGARADRPAKPQP